ncbi:hypothetical protein Bbelb_364850, partial [Branchiostoma belcheri]
GKQGHVNELLHQADNVVINKEPDLDVYEAMAESLGEAWKDLNAQLEDRRLLLDAAILFHESVKQFTDKLNVAHRLFSPLTLPQDVDIIRMQLQKHHQTKKEILEASMETMNRGQVLLDRMQDMGSHLDSKHATTAACYGVEHMLENLHDRRRHMEEVWALQKLRLEKSLQLCIWKQEVNDVTAFYKSQGESYMNASNLGENAPATQILIDLHREITDKAKPMYDQVKRLLRVAESFIVGGHYDSPTIQSMAGNLHVQWETFMDRLDRRTKYLQMAFDFYTRAGEAVKRLEQIDIQLSAHSRQAESTAKLAMLHASLAQEILETVSPPLHDGYILIDLIGRGKPQLAGIEQKVDELEGWKKDLEERCQAHLEDAQQKGEMFLVFQERHAHVRREGMKEGGEGEMLGQNGWQGGEREQFPVVSGEICTCKKGGRERRGKGEMFLVFQERHAHERYAQLFTWLTGVVDTFLAMHADMGTILPAALEFLSNHERLEKDMKASPGRFAMITKSYESRIEVDREPQVDIVLQAAEEFMRTGAVEAHECDVKTRDIQDHWGRVGRVVAKRISLGAIYVAFHKLARRLANEMDDLDELLKRTPTDGTKGLEIAIHRHDDQWKEVREAFTVMERKGREFLSEVKLVRDDPQLDTERAVLCVETLLEHFGERKRTIQDQRTSWQQKLQAEEQFKQDWLRFMEEVKKTIEWIVSLERLDFPHIDISLGEGDFPSSGADLGTNLEDAVDLQDKLRKFMPTAEKTSDVVEGHVKTAEMLAARGETGPQKDSLIMDLLRKTSDVVEGHVKTAEMLAARGETGPQKDSLIMDLLRVHQRFQARLAEYILLLEMAIAFFDNINKTDWLLRKNMKQYQRLSWLPRLSRLPDTAAVNQTVEEHSLSESFRLNMLIDKADKDFKQTSPQDVKQVEDFLRQHEAVKKDVSKVFNHTTDSGERIVLRVRENDGVDAARVTVEQALTMLDMRRIQWLKEWDDHRRRLEQGIKMCQLLKDIEKLREQLSELVDGLQEFQSQLKEAKTSHTISIIMQKFEDFTSQVTTFRYRFEGLSGQVDEALKEGWDNLAPLLSKRKELRDQWQRFMQEFDAFGTRLPLAHQLFTNMQEIEAWLVETTKMLFELEQQAKAVKTKEEAKALLPPVEQKAKEAEMQEGRCRYVSELSVRVHGKDEGEKATRHVVVQFHEVRETITYVRTEIKTKIQTLPSKHDLDMKPQIEVIKKVETPTQFALLSPPPPKKKIVPPSFAQKLTSAVVDEGSPFRFECRVEGDPTPAITWYKDNDNIASSSIYETAFINNVASLTIAEVFVEDEARYMCKASNPGGQAICSAKLTVKALETEPPPQPPILNMNLQDIQVMEGEEITLVVKVTAYPQPDVYWFCDGQPVKESSGVRIVLQGVDTFSLVIKEAFPEDSGMYSVLAKNAHGEAHGSCKVTVERYAETTDTEVMSDSEYVAPTVYETLKDRDVLEGSKIRMDCVIIGTPEPEIIWYFKDKPLKESHNKMLLFEGDKCSLVINEARYSDRGEYKCVAINPAGKAETAMTLEYKCVAINPAGKAETAMTLEYKCVAINPAGKAETAMTLEVERKLEILSWTVSYVLDLRAYILHLPQTALALKVEPLPATDGYLTDESKMAPKKPDIPPVFVQNFEERIYYEGAEARLTCRVQGRPAPTVTWYKDDIQVVPTDHIRIVQIGDTHSVMFKHVGEEDYGIYMCVAVNRAGSVSRCGHVSLKGPGMEPPRFTQELADARGVEGTPVGLVCRVTGKPEPSVVFYRDGNVIHESEDFKIVIQGDLCSLLIPEVLVQDEGKYMARAVNPAGEATTAAVLRVEDEGKYMARAVNPAGEATTDAVLRVQDEGKYMARAVNPAGEATTDAVLRVQDEGKYMARAVNPAGEATTAAVLRVQDEGKYMARAVNPAGEATTAAVLRDEGKYMARAVNPAGEATTAAVLRDEGKYMARAVNPAGEATTAAVLRDEGKYMARAVNPAGEATTAAVLRVEGEARPPTFIKKLDKQLKVKEGRVVMLEVMVDGCPKPKVKWFMDEEPVMSQDYDIIVDGGRHALTIKEVFDEDAGVFKCRAKNSQGEVTCTCQLSVVPPSSDEERERAEAPVVQQPVVQPTVQPVVQPAVQPVLVEEPPMEVERVPEPPIIRNMEPPKFVQPIRSIAVVEGKRAEFEGLVTGDPQPEVTWYKDGQDCTQNPDFEIAYIEGHAKLVIPEVFDEDAGKYTCKAKNQAGTAASTAELVVKAVTEPPDFTQRLQSMQVNEGAEVRLEVRISGVPTPEIKWFREGAEIQTSHDFQIIREGDLSALVIREAFSEDSGKFSVMASNSVGRATSAAHLVITAAEESVAMEATTTEQVQITQAQTQAQQMDLGSGYEPGVTEVREAVVSAAARRVVGGVQYGEQTVSAQQVAVAEEEQRRAIQTSEQQVTVTEQQMQAAASAAASRQVSSGVTITRETREVGAAVTRVSQETSVKTAQRRTERVVTRDLASEKVVSAIDTTPIEWNGKKKPPTVAKKVRTFTPEELEEIRSQREEGMVTFQVEGGEMLRTQAKGKVQMEVEEAQAPPPAPPAEPEAMETGISQPVFQKQAGQQQIYQQTHGKDPMQQVHQMRAMQQQVQNMQQQQQQLQPHQMQQMLQLQQQQQQMQQQQHQMQHQVQSTQHLQQPVFTMQQVEGLQQMAPVRTVQQLPGMQQQVTGMQQVPGTQQQHVVYQQQHATVRHNPGTQPTHFTNTTGYTTGYTPAHVLGEQMQPALAAIHPASVIHMGHAKERVYKAHPEEVMGSPGQRRRALIQLHEGIHADFDACIPYFPKALSDISAEEGECVIFECLVLGEPRPHVKWFREGAEIESSPDFTISQEGDVARLVISEVFIDDAGKFTCTALNEAGSRGPHDFVVDSTKGISKPTFTARLMPCKYVEGQTVIFKIPVDGNPRPEISWTFNGVKLESGVRHMISYEMGFAMLSISMLLPEDCGEYAVTASSPSGQATQKARLMTEEEEKAKKAQRISLVTLESCWENLRHVTEYEMWLREEEEKAKKAQRISLVTEMEEKFSASETEGEAVIKPSEAGLTRKAGIAEARIIESKISMEGYGEYLEAKKSGASPERGPRARSRSPRRDTTEPGVKEKHFRPQIVQRPEDLEVIEGQMARFDLKVSGRPPPDIQWFLNGQPVLDDATHKAVVNEGGIRSLLIIPATPDDSGEYTCVAVNRAGKASFTVRLNVVPRVIGECPEFLQRIQNVQVQEGAPAEMRTRIHGVPYPQIAWQKDGYTISERPGLRMMNQDGMVSLMFDLTDKEDDGWYTAVAFNSAGTVATRCKLTVIPTLKKAEPPQRLVVAKSKRTAEFKREEVTAISKFGEETVDEEDLYDKTRKQRPVFKTKISPVNLEGMGRAHFECRLVPIGDPNMKVEWLNNGQPIEAANRLQYVNEFGFVSMDYLVAYPRDTGIITCRATNQHGEAETSSRLVVKDVPGKIEETQLPEGMRGISKLTEYERKLRESTMRTYVDEAEPEFEKAPPEIVMPPEGCRVVEGEQAKFHCRITGHPQPKVRWYLNGTIIRKSKRFRVWYDGIFHFEIPECKTLYAGEVKVVAENSQGTAETVVPLEVQLKEDYRTILKTPPKTAADPDLRRYHRLKGREEITIKRDRSPGFEMPKLKKVEKVSKEKSEAELASVELQKKFQKRFEPGYYEKLAGMELKGITKEEIKIEAKPLKKREVAVEAAPTRAAPPPEKKPKKEPGMEEPKFIQKLQNQKLKPGEQCRFEARVSGKPEPRVSWFKNGAEITASERIQISRDGSTCVLSIPNPDHEDSGTYVCKADNAAGTASCTAFLLVPKVVELGFTRDLTDVTAQERDATAVFEADVNQEFTKPRWYKDGQEITMGDKYQQQEFTKPRWYKDGQEISMGDKYQQQVMRKCLMLVVRNVTLQDAGQYTCQVEKATSSATLTVTGLPLEVKKPLQNMEAMETGAVTFEIELSQDDLEHQWFHNGVALANSDRVQIKLHRHFFYRLTLKDLAFEDAGEYKFKCRDVTVTAQLVVTERPLEVTRSLQPVTCYETETASFEVEISHEGIEVQWQRKGSVLAPSDRVTIEVSGCVHRLTISNVSQSDAGEYAVVIGDFRQTTQLTVEIRKLEFTRPLQNIKIFEKQTATFEVEINFSGVDVQWLKNGEAIAPSDKFRVHADQKVHRLEILNVTVDDSGEYSFVALDTKATATLYVDTKHVEFIRKIYEPVRCSPGETATFELEISEEDVEGQWFRNEVTLSTSDKYRFEQVGGVRRLYISNVSLEDQGDYSFVANDAQTSVTLYVEVKYVEFRRKPMETITVKPNEVATFEFEVTDQYKDVDVSWYRNEIRIETGEKYKVERDRCVHRLLIADTEQGDSGEYVFVAGETREVVTLYVEVTVDEETPLPDIQIRSAPREPIRIDPHDTAVLEIEISEEDYDAQWLHKDLRLEISDKYVIERDRFTHRLLIYDTLPEDAGDYVFVAGETRHVFTIYVETAHVEMQRTIEAFEVVEYQTATLQFEIDEDVSAVQWLHNDKEIYAGEKYQMESEKRLHKLSIINITQDDAGNYTLVAGEARYTTTLIVKSPLGDTSVFFPSLQGWKKRSQVVIHQSTDTFLANLAKPKPFQQQGDVFLTSLQETRQRCESLLTEQQERTEREPTFPNKANIFLESDIPSGSKTAENPFLELPKSDSEPEAFLESLAEPRQQRAVTREEDSPMLVTGPVLPQHTESGDAFLESLSQMRDKRKENIPTSPPTEHESVSESEVFLESLAEPKERRAMAREEESIMPVSHTKELPKDEDTFLTSLAEASELRKANIQPSPPSDSVSDSISDDVFQENGAEISPVEDVDVAPEDFEDISDAEEDSTHFGPDEEADSPFPTWDEETEEFQHDLEAQAFLTALEEGKNRRLLGWEAGEDTFLVSLDETKTKDSFTTDDETNMPLSDEPTHSLVASDVENVFLTSLQGPVAKRCGSSDAGMQEESLSSLEDPKHRREARMEAGSEKFLSDLRGPKATRELLQEGNTEEEEIFGKEEDFLSSLEDPKHRREARIEAGLQDGKAKRESLQVGNSEISSSPSLTTLEEEKEKGAKTIQKDVRKLVHLLERPKWSRETQVISLEEEEEDSDESESDYEESTEEDGDSGDSYDLEEEVDRILENVEDVEMGRGQGSDTDRTVNSSLASIEEEEESQESLEDLEGEGEPFAEGTAEERTAFLSGEGSEVETEVEETPEEDLERDTIQTEDVEGLERPKKKPEPFDPAFWQENTSSQIQSASEVGGKIGAAELETSPPKFEEAKQEGAEQALETPEIGGEETDPFLASLEDIRRQRLKTLREQGAFGDQLEDQDPFLKSLEDLRQRRLAALEEQSKTFLVGFPEKQIETDVVVQGRTVSFLAPIEEQEEPEKVASSETESSETEEETDSAEEVDDRNLLDSDGSEDEESGEVVDPFLASLEEPKQDRLASMQTETESPLNNQGRLEKFATEEDVFLASLQPAKEQRSISRRNEDIEEHVSSTDEGTPQPEDPFLASLKEPRDLRQATFLEKGYTKPQHAKEGDPFLEEKDPFLGSLEAPKEQRLAKFKEQEEELSETGQPRLKRKSADLDDTSFPFLEGPKHFKVAELQESQDPFYSSQDVDPFLSALQEGKQKCLEVSQCRFEDDFSPSSDGNVLKNNGNVLDTSEEDSFLASLEGPRQMRKAGMEQKQDFEYESFQQYTEAAELELAAPQFTQTLKSHIVEAGEPIRFHGTVSGHPPPQISWLKNGQPIAEGDKYKFVTDGNTHTLLVINAAIEDSAEYACVASNDVGMATSSAQLLVEEHGVEEAMEEEVRPPRILEPIQGTETREGEGAGFTCRIEGTEVDVTWYRNDSPIKPSKFFQLMSEGEYYVLNISEAFPEDAGTYKVVAVNPAGEDQCAADLAVE